MMMVGHSAAAMLVVRYSPSSQSGVGMEKHFGLQ